MERKTQKTQSVSNEDIAPGQLPVATPGIHDNVVQSYGTVRSMPIALSDKVRLSSVEKLNQALANTIMLRELYKKHHWQVSGPTFYQLHLLFDKHYEEQVKLVDAIAERVQMLGGVSIATPHDVAEITTITRPPKDAETPRVQIFRLLEAHGTTLDQARQAVRTANDMGDDGTSDLFISQLIRTNEMQVWFLSEHLVNAPLLSSQGRSELGRLSSGQMPTSSTQRQH